MPEKKERKWTGRRVKSSKEKCTTGAKDAQKNACHWAE